MADKILDKKDLREYQHRIIDFLMRKRFAAVFVDMGLGKTISVLTAINRLLVKGEVESVLLVAPIRVVYSVWRQEARQWRHTRKLTFSIIHGSPKERLEALRKPAHIYLINPDGLAWLKATLGRKQWPWDMLVVDESSMFKKPSTRRFKSIRRGLRDFKRRVIMTGTPTPGGLLELWPQMYIVDRGYSLGSSIGEYKDNHFQRSGYKGYNWVPKHGSHDIIVESVSPRVIRLDAKDWLKLPPVIDVPVWIDLPPEAREVYQRAERQMFLDFEESDIEFVHAASLSNSLCQIAGGAVWTKDKTDPEKKVWVPIHDAKLDALAEIIDELQGEPPLIAYRFIHDLERLRTAYPKFGVIGKGSKPQEVERTVDRWNKGKLPGIIIHPASGGHGLNMQKGGRHLIWYSMTWSLELYLQLIKRLHRGVITRNVLNYMILVRDTVEESIIEAIERKDQGQSTFNDALRHYYRQRYG